MEKVKKLLDVEKNRKCATLNGGVGIILNFFMAAGVIASMDRRYGLMIGVVFMFLVLWVTSIRAMIQLYDVKYRTPEDFQSVKVAFTLNVFNLILMSIGFTATSFWYGLMLDF